MNKEPVEYIFCISTGRSGTNYLFNIFAALDGCVALHEPRPVGNKLPMRKFLSGDESALRKLLPEKLHQIDVAKGAASLYVETNHCFVKGFGWLIPERIDPRKIGVVILRRDRERVVESYFRVNTTPLNARGRRWLMLPSKRAAEIQPPRLCVGPRFSYALVRALALPFRSERIYRRLNIRPPQVPRWIASYERAGLRWYYDETYAMAERYRHKFPAIRCFDADVDDLNNPVKVKEMLDCFGLEYDDKIDEVIGRPTNLKLEKDRR